MVQINHYKLKLQKSLCHVCVVSPSGNTKLKDNKSVTRYKTFIKESKERMCADILSCIRFRFPNVVPMHCKSIRLTMKFIVSTFFHDSVSNSAQTTHKNKENEIIINYARIWVSTSNFIPHQVFVAKNASCLHFFA